jgi:UDP-glucose 4-epimerase
VRVVVVGATGNVGTSLLEALAVDAEVTSVVGIARRRPATDFAKTEWVEADITGDSLEPHFRDAHAVVHLAWIIQPSRDPALLHEVNVEGSRRVFEAAARAGVPALVYASSIGAYSAGPKDRRVDESWPTEGTPTSFYARHKAEVERILDGFEREHPAMRVARLRPGLIFKRGAASEIRRYFAGPFFPGFLLRRGLIPVFPLAPGLSFQCVHSDDVADAYRRCVVRDVSGAFNIAAEPVVGEAELRRVLGARKLSVPPSALRLGAAATWRLHLQPTPEGWADMGLAVPTMDTSRARSELGWQPRYTSLQALEELLAGLRDGAGIDTPPLSRGTGGPARLREIAQGVGRRPGV